MIGLWCHVCFEQGQVERQQQEIRRIMKKQSNLELRLDKQNDRWWKHQKDVITELFVNMHYVLR